MHHWYSEAIQWHLNLQSCSCRTHNCVVVCSVSKQHHQYASLPDNDLDHAFNCACLHCNSAALLTCCVLVFTSSQVE